jgi:hypothetical protein
MQTFEIRANDIDSAKPSSIVSSPLETCTNLSGDILPPLKIASLLLEYLRRATYVDFQKS